jgi:glutaminase
LTTIDEEDFAVGDSNENFSIQSISKALTVALAFSLADENMEASGNRTFKVLLIH